MAESRKTSPVRKEYKTRSGIAVRELMEGSRGAHLTAEDVLHSLKSQGIPMGLTTVYRQLERLTEEGAVRKIYGDKQGYCYQAVTKDCLPHYHMVCTVCGKLLHLDCEKAGHLFAHITEEHGFHIDPHRTVLYGTCRSCARQTKQREGHHAV